MRLLIYVIIMIAKNTESHVGKTCVAFSVPKEMNPMPRRPQRPCSYPGCPNLCDGQYCDKHKSEARRKYDKYERPAEINKKYGRAWKRIRDKYVSEHPFCELCFEKGMLIPTREVHHKRPLSEGGTHERSNLIALCKSCHAKIHAERGDYQGSKKYRVYSYDK